MTLRRLDPPIWSTTAPSSPVTAWRGSGRFEGRSSLRSWLYRIATKRQHRHVERAKAPSPSDGHGTGLGAADLLDSTVAAVNSALQRARATMAARDLDDDPSDPVGEVEQILLDRYVDAFQRYDIASLVSLLHEDATQSMPPYPMWLRGRDDIGRWLLGPGSGCAGSVLVPVRMNGRAGFAQYRASPDGHCPFSLQVVDITDGRISRFTHYVDPRLFALFGLPDELP